MAKLSVQNLKDINAKLSERIGGRGDGSLLFIRRESETIEAYYRYKHLGKEVKIKLGHYQSNDGALSQILDYCREKSRDLARLRRQYGGDLKGYLEAKEHKKEQQKLEEQQRQEMEARKGSFADLMESYVLDQQAQGKESAHQSRQAFRLNVLDAYPMIAAKKAKDVTPDDIVTILAAIHQRGSEVESVFTSRLLQLWHQGRLRSDADCRKAILYPA